MQHSSASPFRVIDAPVIHTRLNLPRQPTAVGVFEENDVLAGYRQVPGKRRNRTSGFRVVVLRPPDRRPTRPTNYSQPIPERYVFSATLTALATPTI
jgi:hypothetical protein